MHEGQRHAHRHGDGEQQARRARRDARVAEDLRHPAHRDVGGGGLEPEEDGQRPGGRLRVIRTEGSARGRRRRPSDGARAEVPRCRTSGEPGQYGDGGERRPDGEAGTPTAAQRRGHGDGDARRRARCPGPGPWSRGRSWSRPGPGNQRLTITGMRTLLTAMPISARALATRKPAVPPGERPDRRPARDRDHAGADHGAGSEAAGQPGRRDAEDGEAQRRHGGEQPGDAAAHAEAVADLFQEGAEAGDGGAEVERGEDDADDHQPRQPRARPVAGGRGRSRRPWRGCGCPGRCRSGCGGGPGLGRGPRVARSSSAMRPS